MNTLPRFLALTMLTLPATVAVRAQVPDARAPEKAQAPVPPGFALIPPGEFVMGDALDGDQDAKPHKVSVSAFYMQKNLVTKAQWDEVRVWALQHGYTDLSEGLGKAADHPVVMIPWFDVVKWCNARSEEDSLTPSYYTDAARTKVYRAGKTDLTSAMVTWNATGYRLPTEAEWEKAARGGLAGKRFPWGDTISHSKANFFNFGNMAYQTGSAGVHPDFDQGDDPGTSPVGSFAANRYGLHDMAGNASEWCWDRCGDHPAAAETDPNGVLAGSIRALRGGGWNDIPYYCRVAHRSTAFAGYAFISGGFRPARSVVR